MIVLCFIFSVVLLSKTRDTYSPIQTVHVRNLPKPVVFRRTNKTKFDVDGLLVYWKLTRKLNFGRKKDKYNCWTTWTSYAIFTALLQCLATVCWDLPRMSAGSANADKGVVSAVCSSFQTEEGMRLKEKLQLVAGKKKHKDQDDRTQGTKNTKVGINNEFYHKWIKTTLKIMLFTDWLTTNPAWRFQAGKLLTANKHILKVGLSSEKRSLRSKEIIQDMNIPGLVLLRLFTSSNYKCDVAHAL